MTEFELRKTTADKLSHLLPLKDKKDKAQAAKMLKELGYDHYAQPRSGSDSNGSFPRGHIGIYKPEIIEGEIVYNRDIDFIDRWTFFADLPVIYPKKDKKRVVFLGESVARGFLLDPGYTPAIVLDKLINTNSSADKFEVVDLAEVNLSMQGIQNRFEQCLDLEPDLVIFFAGNNWCNDFFHTIGTDKNAFQAINSAFRKVDNIGEIKPELEKVFEKMIIDFLTFVSQKMKEHNFPVIMAIPEFNLLDCRSTPGERRVTYLSGDNIKKWSDSYKEAHSAQVNNDLEMTAIHAQKMIDIDPSHPLGYEMLADVKIEQGDFKAARELFELGRDTAIFCRSNSKPRIFQVIRRTLLEHATKMGIEILDIPEVFKHHLDGKVPGKDLFLDYCHLTAKGIQVAMEPLADQVLTLTGNHNRKILPSSRIKPDKHILAMGHFFAAIHNEHWGQAYYILEHHCMKALEASKEVAKIMVYYCDMISRNVSNNLTKSLEMILVENIQIDRYGHALMHPKDLKIMEIDLVNAMVSALEREGVQLNKFVKELRKKEHGVDSKTVDLLSPFYYATSFDEFQGIRPAFFQVRDITSTFYIVASEKKPIDLFISFRVPSSEAVVGMVEFWFNGSFITTLTPQSKWVTHELTISGEYCKEGINELVISWPVPKTVEKTIDQTLLTTDSLLNAIYYVFGEVSHFRATGVKEAVVVEKAVESVS